MIQPTGRHKTRTGLLAAVLAVLAISPLSADFTLSRRGDPAVLATGAALLGASLVLERVLPQPSWDDALPPKAPLNPLDRLAINPYRASWDVAGTAVEAVLAVCPLVLCFAEGKESRLPLLTLYAESVLISQGAKGLLKDLVHRARPYMRTSSRPADALKNGDHARSFPSGHAATAFNGAAFLTYAFCHLNPASPWRIPVAAVSFTLAAFCGVSRVAAGKHFPTDVLTGAAIGVLTGILVPRFHRNDGSKHQNGAKFSAALLPNGFVVELAI